MRLYIVRHAWAEEPNDFRWPSDSERPLTEEGRKRFRRMVSKLVERGFRPRRIATSPYVRTMQTAEILTKLFPKDVAIEPLPALAPGARLEELLMWSAQQNEPEIAWIGHMPDVAEMTSTLIGSGSGRIAFNKGSIAAIDFEDRPDVGRGVLCWLLTARTLGC